MVGSLVSTEDGIAGAKALTDLLINMGIIGEVSGWPLRWFRGQRPKRVEPDPDRTTTITTTDDAIIVDKRTIILLQDP